MKFGFNDVMMLFWLLLIMAGMYTNNMELLLGIIACQLLYIKDDVRIRR